MLLRNFLKALFLFFLESALLNDIYKNTNVKAQSSPCSLVSALFNEGKSTIYYQLNMGFCKEWIVGPITTPQRILVSFTNVNIDCSKSDALNVYNDDRTYLLYSYCLQSNQIRPLSATFDMILVDTPMNSLIQTARPPIHINPIQIITSLPSTTKSTTQTTTTTTRPSTTIARLINDPLCPSPFLPGELTDIYGNIKSPVLRQSYISLNCSWVIKAPPNQRVYLLFDHINLPTFDPNQNECYFSYISIASQLRPDEDYKLCGSRRGVKLVTTYNNVLLNFVSSSIASFSLIYRIIADPSELIPPTTTEAPPPSFYPQLVSLSPNLKCGSPYFQPTERIVGGVEAIPNSWPWQVLITDGLIMCGATLISDSWVVTAAHCTENINSGPIRAIIGMHNRIKQEANKVTRFVTQVVLHPNYMGRLTQWDFDIALMKLQEPVKFSNVISPICLPPQGINFATLGSKGWVTGWGDTQGTGSASVLRQAPITVKKNKECGANSDNMLCAGDKEPLHDSCQGDSGGPFFMRKNNNYYLVGIVSWGYDCGGAGVYTKVSNFVNWINKITSG